MRAIICIFLIFVCCIFTASALDDYDYYQSISYSACDQAIYQQDVIIHRTTGDAYEETSGGLNIWHLYVDDHCQVDFDDVRFSDPKGTELAYHLCSGYDSTEAKFVVNMTTANTDSHITMLYGNDLAVSTSNVSNTYVYFDDFEAGMSGWSSSGTYRFQIVSPGYDEIGNALKISAYRSSWGTSYWNGYKSIYFPGYPVQISVYTKGRYVGDSYDTYHAIGVNSDVLTSYTSGSSWRKIKTTANYTGYNTIKLLLRSYWYKGEMSTYWDNLCIRAYSATPPTASDFSGEIYAGYVNVRSYPGYNIPTDPDADGLYEDVNGNGRLDFQDIMIFFQYNAWAKANQPKVECWDWSGNGAIEFSDVQAFWEAEFT